MRAFHSKGVCKWRLCVLGFFLGYSWRNHHAGSCQAYLGRPLSQKFQLWPNRIKKLWTQRSRAPGLHDLLDAILLYDCKYCVPGVKHSRSGAKFPRSATGFVASKQFVSIGQKGRVAIDLWHRYHEYLDVWNHCYHDPNFIGMGSEHSNVPVHVYFRQCPAAAQRTNRDHILCHENQ